MASLNFYACNTFFLLFSIFSNAAFPKAQEYDRVINLPGQPTSPNISQFSGYVTVNEDHGRALFYWFFEAQSEPQSKPLLLWLNGGPGCSSIGYGAAVELGPLLVKKKGLEFNNYAWNKESNLLFVESPVGVGFSYTSSSSDFIKINDAFVAEDSYHFLVNWLERFPQYKSHDFYMSGESYAGHYVPQLAELVNDRNKQTEKYPFINLKGFIVGNPLTADYYDSKGLLEYAWSHAVISDEVYKQANDVCNFKNYNWTDNCTTIMNVTFKAYDEIDIYNIYAPICIPNNGSSSNGTVTSKQINASLHKENDVRSGRTRIPGGYDPCFEAHTEEFFNRADVRLSLHVNENASGRWKTCNDSILQKYDYVVWDTSHIYTKLIKAGLKIWVYSGDTDGRVPVTGSRYWIDALGLPLNSPWRSWYHKDQVGGRIIDYVGLTFVTVRGAGHLVPLNKPSEAFAIIHSYLYGENLPGKA